MNIGVLICQTGRRFGNTERVFTHNFDSVSGWESSDHSITRIEREKCGFGGLLPPVPIPHHSKNLGTVTEARSWCPGSIQKLLAAGLTAFLGLVLVIVFQNIRLAPDKVLLKKDATELSSLETQPRMEDPPAKPQSLPLATVGKARIADVSAPMEDHPQSEASKSRLIARLASSAAPNRNTDLGGARKHPRAFKRDLESRGHKDRNPQTQKAVAPARQRCEPRGLSSFFAGISRALGFSTNRGVSPFSVPTSGQKTPEE